MAMELMAVKVQRVLTLLLLTATQGGFSQSQQVFDNSGGPVTMTVYDKETDTPSRWAATLHCAIVVPAPPSPGCTSMWWSHVHTGNSDEDDEDDDVGRNAEEMVVITGGGGGGGGGGGSDDEDDVATDEGGETNGIGTGNQDVYRVHTQLTTLTSQLDILRADDVLRGRYSCWAACGRQTYSVSCVMENFLLHNRSFHCSEKTFTPKTTQDFVVPHNGTNSSPSPSATEQRKVIDVSADAGGTRRQGKQLRQGSDLIMAVCVVIACLALLLLVAASRWYGKRRAGCTSRGAGRRAARHRHVQPRRQARGQPAWRGASGCWSEDMAESERCCGMGLWRSSHVDRPLSALAPGRYLRALLLDVEAHQTLADQARVSSTQRCCRSQRAVQSSAARAHVPAVGHECRLSPDGSVISYDLEASGRRQGQVVCALRGLPSYADAVAQSQQRRERDDVDSGLHSAIVDVSMWEAEEERCLLEAGDEAAHCGRPHSANHHGHLGRPPPYAGPPPLRLSDHHWPLGDVSLDLPDHASSSDEICEISRPPSYLSVVAEADRPEGWEDNHGHATDLVPSREAEDVQSGEHFAAGAGAGLDDEPSQHGRPFRSAGARLETAETDSAHRSPPGPSLHVPTFRELLERVLADRDSLRRGRAGQGQRGSDVVVDTDDRRRASSCLTGKPPPVYDQVV